VIDRTKTIGGSDVAAILGLSPWRSPLDVWREKTLGEADQRDTLLPPDLFNRFRNDAFWRDPARIPPGLRVV
jgi:hypothetical protein